MLLGQVLLPATVAICLSLALGAALMAVGKRNRVDEGGDAVAAATATFAALHYGAGLVLTLVASLSAGALVGVLRQSPESGAAVGIAVSVGGLLAAVVGLVGTLVAAAAAGDAPSEARKSTRRQLAGGAVTSLLAASFAVGGVAGLFAVFTRLLDHPAGDAALEVAGFALGASIVGFVAQVGAGVFAESALVAHLLLPRIDRTISPSELENASSTTRAAGQHASASAVSGASAFETTAAGLVGALVLGVANYQVTDNAGWLLLPLLTMAVGTLATVLGLAWPFVVGRRGPALRQATTTGLWLVFLAGAGGGGLLSYILIQDGWYWAAGCILLGLGGSVALHYIVRAYLGASGRAARFVGEAAEVGAVPSLLAGSSVGLEAAGATVLTLAVVVGGSALGGMEAAPAGIHTASGAALGVALAAVGMLMSNPYRGCLAGLDAATGPRPDRAGPRGDGPGESTGTGDPPEGSLPPTSRIHSALTATMVVAVLLAGFGTALRGEFDSLAYEHPERAVRLSQDAGTTRPGLDVLAEIVNALSGYRDDLESCGLDIATVRGLLVKDPIETAASLAAAPGDDGGRVCAAAENGSPLPLPQLLSIGPGRPEVLVGVLLGVLLALVIGALVLRTVWDTSGRLAGEIRRQSGAGRTLPDGEIAPATDEVARLAAGAALRASLRPGLVLVFLLVGGGAAMRFAPGTAGNGGWLAVEGLLAGLLLSNLLVGAVSVFTGAVRSAEGASDWGTALARPNRDSELPVIFRSPYITALGPAVHSAATLASLAALVLIPLFIG